MLRKVVNLVNKAPRSFKKGIMVATDLFLIPFSLWFSLSLRLGEFYTDFRSTMFLFVAVPFFTIPIFARMGLYRAVMRYVGRAAVQQIFTGVVISAGIVLVLTLANWPNGLPRSVFAIYGFVAFTLIGATRLLARAIFGGRGEWRGKRVAVYGAGESGRQLVSLLRAGHEYRPVLFVDDSPELVNREVEGLRVHNPGDPGLETHLTRSGVVAVFLAMPAVTRTVKRRILKRLEEMPFHVYTVPRLNEIVSGAAPINQLREVAVEDLLGRDPVPPDELLLRRYISGHSVMVTGAGGSIGSELCRQIIARAPATLVLYDQSEYALFSIDSVVNRIAQELNLDTRIVSVLGSVCDSANVERTMIEHRITTVYHAAAYKHVPLVEHNPLSGVVNNVFGTRAVADAAKNVGVERFVFVSTDKAVRPTNVMGASKRLGELVLQALAPLSKTVFCIVRFGNVLGSSGSVLPLFRQQIASGGPVTVTHPDIIRYFMTIPESVELVIQAGAMAGGGEVFVLDMGEPVKIYDLAKQLIHLSGLEVKDENNPDGDIEIVFTGLRSGEKLYEELLIGGDVSGTEHPKILQAQEDMLSPELLSRILARLETAVASNDVESARALLAEAVAGYRPSQLADDDWSDNIVSVGGLTSGYTH